MICSFCGTEIEDDATFCVNCGQKVIAKSETEETSNDEESRSSDETPISEKTPSKKKNKTLIIVIIAAILLLLAVGVFILTGFGVGIGVALNSSSNSAGNQELYYITDEDEVFYYDFGKKESLDLFEDKGGEYKTLFGQFPDSLNLKGLNIFHREKKEFVYIDYYKSKIYRINTKKDEKEKLCDASFVAFGTDDMLYYDRESQQYVWKSLSDDESMEFPEDLVEISVGKDYKNYAFVNEDDKAYVVYEGNKEKIDNNVINVYMPKDYPDKSILYVKYEDDINLTSVWRYDIDGTKRCILDEDPDGDYSDSVFLGYDLGTYIFTEYQDNYSISYFDGYNLKEVMNEVKNLYIYSFSEEGPYMAVYADGESYFVSGAKTRLIEAEDVHSVTVSDNGAKIAVVSEDANSYRLEAYGVNDDLTLRKLYEKDDVYEERVLFARDGRLIYFTDFNADEGCMYIDENKIADDVDVNSVRVFEGKKNYIGYLTDNQSYGGTLYLYDGQQSTKISEDIFNYYVLQNGAIVLLRDYSQVSGKGDLAVYQKGKESVIAEDVVGFYVQTIKELNIPISLIMAEDY